MGMWPIVLLPRGLGCYSEACFTLLHFTREMRSFSFPYPSSQKEEERSWDNLQQFPPAAYRREDPFKLLLPLLSRGGEGNTGWSVGYIPLKDYSELLLLSPPRPFASMVCCLCGNKQQVSQMEVLAEVAV